MELSRLSSLHGVALVRKCALLLEATERKIDAPSGSGDAAQDGRSASSEGFAYAVGIASFLSSSPEASAEAAQAAREYLSAFGAADPGSTQGTGPHSLRALNAFRHALRRISGQSTADWDLVEHGTPVKGDRKFLPGLRAFLEDVRSPFNVGSVLRTAEAFGFEEVLLSPGCADPRHPRAARSSMGAVDLIPWRRCSLAELQDLGPLMALELGGLRIEDFSFPARAVLVLGSEELGVSEPALILAGQRRLTIPMLGAKASINVAVAFGIAAHAWAASTAR